MFSNFVSDFHFLRPWWFLALIPTLLIIWKLFHRQNSAGDWSRVVSPHLLKHLLTGPLAKKSRIPIFMLGTVWLLAIFALAGPTFQRISMPVKEKINARVFVLQLSTSMNVADVSPSRLIRAKQKLGDMLAKEREGLFALVVYAGDAHIVTPLTDDVKTIESLIKPLHTDIMPVEGNNPIEAMKLAARLLGEVGSGDVIWLSDGSGNWQPKEIKELLKKYEISLYVLGIGTEQGGPVPGRDGGFLKDRQGDPILAKLNMEPLKKIADRYEKITTGDQDIEYLLNEKRSIKDETRLSEHVFDQWEDKGYLFLIMLLPILLFAFRKNQFRAMLGLCVIILSPDLRASYWDDLWLRKDEQGAKAFQNGDNKKAAELFENPDWKAASLYKDKQYDEAIKNYSSGKSADHWYNIGNALAHGKKLDEAIKAYEKALELEPNHEDAKFNKALLEKSKLDKLKQESENKDQQQEQDKKDQEQSDKSKENQDQDQEQQKQDDSKKDQEEKKGEQEQKKSQEEQEKKDKENAQQEKESAPKQEDKKEDPKKLNEEAIKESQSKSEKEQEMEQWLKKIPDDPGGLLRRKFLLESQRRRQKQGS